MTPEELERFVMTALDGAARAIEGALATTDQTMRCIVVLIGTDTGIMVRAKNAHDEEMQIALLSALGRSFGGTVEIEANPEAVH
jgi:hypothetical protein